MKVRVEVTEQDARKIIAQHISEATGNDVDPKQVKIEVKSKQNYRSEWEASDFRAVYEGDK